MKRIVKLSALVFAVASLTMACDSIDTDPTPERQKLQLSAKADAPTGTCEGKCGGKGKGGCWCDDECATYGDCCADMATFCDPDAGCLDDADCASDQFCQEVWCITAPCPWMCAPKGGEGANCSADNHCLDGLACVDNSCTAEAPDPCYIGGCSGQICSDKEGVITTCEWLPIYGCYKMDGASCERQADGSCGWTMEGEAAQCVDDVTACKPVMCELYCAYGFAVDENGCEICECNPAPGCTTDADCAKDQFCQEVWCITAPCPWMCAPKGGEGANCGADNHCLDGLTCVDNSCTAEAPDPCYIGGCSGQICSDKEGVITTCEWLPIYGCYKMDGASCERQADGACGWTMEGEAAQCVEDLTQCQPVMCELYCAYGFAVDENGCEICKCNPAPGCSTDDDCAEGEFCQQVWCITAPCPWMCTPKGDVGASCSSDAMCIDGLSCVDGACAKAATSACEGYCGSQAPDGCWCDAACADYGDCCDGKADVCS